MGGGGKETPRQKMIGMMYLVLTALLAMNVSKQILQGYLSVNESLVKSINNLKDNNERVTKSFESSINGNAAARPYFEKAIEAQKEIHEMEHYIDELKSSIIAHIEPTALENEKIADTLNLRRMEKMDDYDGPSHVLGIGDPKQPEKGKHTAFELRTKLNQLHDKLVGLVDGMQKDPKTKFFDEDYQGIKKKFASIKPTDSNRDEDGIKFNWEMDNFYHLPLAAVVTNLNKFKTDLKNVEAEVLQVFSGASGKLAIKFDHLEAKVIAPSSYVQAGQPYTADIMLAASSSKLGKGDLEFHVGGTYDSISKKFTPGNLIDVQNGLGKYSVGTGGQGEQKFSGIIKFKKPDGSFEYYPFAATYLVAAPAVAVEAEKMNVFYIGVDNPIAVSAAGIAPTELVVNATGAGCTKTGGAGGKFILKFSSPGECLISVSAKTKDGVKPQGPPKKFRVKKIPDPVAKVGGKTGNVDMKKSELASIAGVGAELAGFDFDARFTVVSFELSAVVKGNLKSEQCSGNNLSSGAKTILASCGVGSKIFVDNVKAKGPDGTLRNIPGVTIKVK
ncbi:MAG: gliding motility protein GldM [Bacteroidota bacterium]